MIIIMKSLNSKICIEINLVTFYIITIYIKYVNDAKINVNQLRENRIIDQHFRVIFITQWV